MTAVESGPFNLIILYCLYRPLYPRKQALPAPKEAQE